MQMVRRFINLLCFQDHRAQVKFHITLPTPTPLLSNMELLPGGQSHLFCLRTQFSTQARWGGGGEKKRKMRRRKEKKDEKRKCLLSTCRCQEHPKFFLHVITHVISMLSSLVCSGSEPPHPPPHLHRWVMNSSCPSQLGIYLFTCFPVLLLFINNF